MQYLPFLMRTSCITVLVSSVLLCGCKQTRTFSDIHPYRDKDGLFEAPTVNINSILYKSVQTRDNLEQDPDLAVVVAISGGGERAANFGAGVLIGLEKIISDSGGTNALAEVDYFSTVSGGGMTAAGYISSLYDYIDVKKSRDGYSFLAAMTPPVTGKGMECLCKHDSDISWSPSNITDPCLRRHFERGYHNNLSRGIGDNLWRMLTFSVRYFDFGNELESSFDDEILGKRWRSFKRDGSLSFGDMFVPRDDPNDVRLPYWVANATAFENGAIFPFTPDILSLYKISGYTHGNEGKVCTNGNYSDVPLALGLTASGAFPLIPALKLESNIDPEKKSYLYLYDGGLSDNLGVITACDILKQEKTKRKVLIVIDAYTGTPVPYSRVKKPPFLVGFARKQIASMSLDSWRGRYKKIIKAILNSENGSSDIEVIYISFDDLYNKKCNGESEDVTKSNEIFKALEEDAYGYIFEMDGFRDLKKYMKDNKRELTPYTAARSIKVSYNIKAHEQDFLIAIGRYLVNEKCKSIKEALWPRSDGLDVEDK